MIIDGKQNKLRKLLEGVLTSLGWSYIFFFSVQLIASLMLWYFNIKLFHSELFTDENIQGTIRVFTINVILALINFIIMYTWGMYNAKKFGRLHRRKFLNDVTNAEVANYFQIPESQVEHFQKSEWIELEETIV
ncbi:poly-beta-1,6-N-acetyl-D-glucosamine biosynthesis protein PgaD [Heliobacterium chlorum]|uniref:Poly-beta-1,6-N-acetyl-D-glucosamine biosynthesis protein PgaD n=1 Tax=Heliobacterium chlorum TaxID=2698 RepID=A0ABR7T2B4_HELCL|nr:poly-beta-1,6-N-acetyl-D-glucosamine biosynthesis protein PgaD [Heliobacterium chlorum]